MKRKKRYLAGLIILALVAGYLLYVFIDTSESSLTVSGFFEKGTELYDTPEVIIAGKVAAPIDWNAEDSELKFNLTEGGETLTVVYDDAPPPDFKEDSNILVEGEYISSDGIFRATKLIMKAKCPSEYEGE